MSSPPHASSRLSTTKEHRMNPLPLSLIASMKKVQHHPHLPFRSKSLKQGLLTTPFPLLDPDCLVFSEALLEIHVEHYHLV